MTLTENWWRAEIDWNTVAGQFLQKFLSQLPSDRHFQITLYGSAPLQLTVDRSLLSGDIDLFPNDEQDIAAIIRALKLDKESGGIFYLEAGYELSFRTSPLWRSRAKTFQLANVTLTLPHPFDILIGKLDRLAPKDIKAFEIVIAATGHPTAGEMKHELQNAVDLFRPSFDEESPNRYTENTERLWREIFKSEIDVRKEIIAPAIARRKEGYGETPPDYKSILRQ
ncbi:MAG: hypothetical protein ABIR24_07570 [Verrucomicrobiota bacterium]